MSRGLELIAAYHLTGKIPEAEDLKALPPQSLETVRSSILSMSYLIRRIDAVLAEPQITRPEQ